MRERIVGKSTRFMVEYYSLLLLFSRIKMNHLISIFLSFSSIIFFASANEQLNILMPDAVANHVRILY